MNGYAPEYVTFHSKARNMQANATISPISKKIPFLFSRFAFDDFFTSIMFIYDG